MTGAADDDPSGIATYSQAGAQFGYGLLLTMVLTCPRMCAVQLVSAHIGRVTGAVTCSRLKPGMLLDRKSDCSATEPNRSVVASGYVSKTDTPFAATENDQNALHQCAIVYPAANTQERTGLIKIGSSKLENTIITAGRCGNPYNSTHRPFMPEYNFQPSEVVLIVRRNESAINISHDTNDIRAICKPFGNVRGNHCKWGLHIIPSGVKNGDGYRAIRKFHIKKS